MEKSDKTMAEMNIELNLTYEFDRITEAGEALQALAGPGCACCWGWCARLWAAMPGWLLGRLRRLRVGCCAPCRMLHALLC